jgi:two-component system chemotaxis response regulator CheY
MAYNVLIVDDSVTIRAVLKKTLSISGLPVAEIFEAGNGKEALSILEQSWVDIVFADINMPVMSGIEMVDRLVESGQISTTPVVMVSTEGSQTRIEELIKKGVRAFVRKPITPELLKDVIEDVLGKEKIEI